MKKLMCLMMMATLSLPGFAAEETLYNTTTERSVLDMATDPELKPYENGTALYELCFKGDIDLAYTEILNLEELELLFHPDTESYIDSIIIGDSISVLALNGKMMDDGLSEEEAIVEYTITECTF